MPEPTVHVRFVPKSDNAHPLRSAADETRATLASLKLSTDLSPGLAIHAHVPTERFAELFGVPLRERRHDTQHATFAHTDDTHLEPDGEINIPETLRNSVEFAYVPTPPACFSPTSISAIPPNTTNYHLRLEDVVRALNAPRCHRKGWTGRGVRIAMADTGFARHRFFDDYGFAVTRVHPTRADHAAIDPSGHGTGESANALVVAPDAELIGAKFGHSAAEAIDACLNHNPDILTNSWGWDADTTDSESLKRDDPNLYNEFRDIERIILSAIARGVVVVFAAGNGQRAFPACIPDVIAAGGAALNPDGSLAASDYASSFTSSLYPGRLVPDICGVVGRAGREPLDGHIMLPVPPGSALEGANISRAADRNRGWGVFSGTSAAAPQIAGIAALIRSVDRHADQHTVKAILSDTARDVSTGESAMRHPADEGYDPATGPGLADAFAACNAAEKQILARRTKSQPPRSTP